MPGSQFCDLGYRYATDASEIPVEFGESWNKALEEERYIFSIRDREFGCVKDFATSRLGNALAGWFLSGQQRRNAFKWILPSMSGIRYSLTHWLVEDAKMKDAMLVIKTNMKLGWMLYLVNREPSIPVFHIIRHPAGYFLSMKNRYIELVGEGAARKGAIDRLEKIAMHDSNWRAKFDLFGTVNRMSMVELSICWWWCFNETLYLAARDNKKYLAMRFEDVVGDPLVWAENIYTHAGVEDGVASLRRAESLAQQGWRSKQRCNSYMDPKKENIGSWRKKLSEQEVGVVFQVLKNSAFKNLWHAE